MNTNRSNFNMPENHIVITKSWLLGFLEGEGSFNLNRSTFEPVFSIFLTEKQLPVLMKIKGGGRRSIAKPAPTFTYTGAPRTTAP